MINAEAEVFFISVNARKAMIGVKKITDMKDAPFNYKFPAFPDIPYSKTKGCFMNIKDVSDLSSTTCTNPLHLYR
jgi:hypothetical protein